jgi:hypothetical protein
MKSEPITDWQFWSSLKASCLPLSLILDAQKVRSRDQMRDVSESAYIFRMFELFFSLRHPEIITRLTGPEKTAVVEFISAYDALPWQLLPAHPHISELHNNDIQALASSAKKLSHRLWLRTGSGIYPVLYRVIKGWRILEPPVPKK